MSNDQQLSDVLCEFARTMVTDFPIQAILDHLVVRIVDVLPIDAAGVTLIAPGTDPRYVAASDASALRFEELQSEVGEGPCLEAYRTAGAVAVPDLREEARFPAFTPLALKAGLVAVFTFPLREGTDCLGALDLYRRTPGPMDDGAMAAAQTLADVAAAYLTNAQTRGELRDAADRYREGALHDALTGLANRVLLGQRVDHAVQRARRSHRAVALLFVDLDRFKEVNDEFGHRTGDGLLIEVAQRLGDTLRPGDTLARLSGDEFVVLCEDLEEPTLVQRVAERIQAALDEPFVVSGHELTVSASVGIAFAGSGDDVPERLLRDADVAMYQAKRKGGGRHQIIDLREQRQAEGRASLVRDLRVATSRGELRLDYQPIVATADGRVSAVEALLRWDHPTRGLVPPMTVVELAEEGGLITQIGEWVLDRACRDRDAWPQAGGGDLRVAVNVSAGQLMQAGFLESAAEVLGATRTGPAQLILELTESVFIDDVERALVVLHELKRLGVTLALDAFGTGYSSLSDLQRFPVDIVKLDRAFVATLSQHRASSMIVSAVTQIAHALDMTVVAEGIETAGQHAQVGALACDSCQGYYFARPMPAANIADLLRDHGTDGDLRLPIPRA